MSACTRKRKVGDVDFIPNKGMIKAGISYIKKTPQVRDVLLSGGDPFMLSDEYLDWILTEIRAIPHIESYSYRNTNAVVLPYRVTDDLVKMLKKHHPVWINTHFNHPREITASSKEALANLQMPVFHWETRPFLLAGVNDCPRIMRALVHQLSKIVSGPIICTSR